MKFSKRQLSIFAAFVLVIGLFVGAKKILADSSNNTYGYAWSSNIGWIKMNNCESNDPATCAGSGYGVTVMPIAPGTISGYAWSSNIGWITFNDPSCPVSGCTPGARADWDNKNGDGSVNIKGWARACSIYASGCSGALIDTSASGQWDGYIALDSSSGGGAGGSWGWKIGADKSVTGYAWGSSVIGWVKSVTMAIDASATTVTLTANPTSISRGQSSTLTVNATNIDGPSACTFTTVPAATIPTVVMANTSGQVWTGSVPVSPLLTTDYTVHCTKGPKTVTATATVTVTYFATPPGDGGTGGNGGNGAGGYCALKNPQFAWDTSAASCTITRQDGATQTVAGSSKAAGGSLGTDGAYYFTSNLSVVGTASTYKLQCGSGATAVNLSVSASRCIPDYSISATPDSQTLVPVGKDSLTATFTVSINSLQGFTGPIDLSVGSMSPLIPKSAITSFSPITLTDSNGIYGTSQFTITVPAADLKTSLANAPIVIQGNGSGIIRQATVKVGAVVKTKPTYNEF
jgi:hypothetical protein